MPPHDARSEGTKALIAIRVRRSGDDGHGAAVEVVLGKDDYGVVVFHAFHVVGPFAGKLYRRFHAFSAAVHGQNHIVSKILCDELLKFTQLVVVKSAGSESKFPSLIAQCLYDLGVAMALVHG